MLQLYQQFHKSCFNHTAQKKKTAITAKPVTLRRNSLKVLRLAGKDKICITIILYFIPPKIIAIDSP